MSLASWLFVDIAVRRAKKEGRKPYPENHKEWLLLFVVLCVILFISYLLTVAFK